MNIKQLPNLVSMIVLPYQNIKYVCVAIESNTVVESLRARLLRHLLGQSTRAWYRKSTFGGHFSDPPFILSLPANY